MAFVYHQIFCDESGKYHNPNDPLIAFAGVCVTPDRLNAFNNEWRVLLRSYELPALHMKKVSRLVESHGYRLEAHQTVDQRTELLIPFADCINKHLEMGFIQAWDVRAFNMVSLEAKKLLGGSSDPYFWAFTRGLCEIVDRMGDDDRISIICDDDETTAWDSYCHYRAAGKPHAKWEIRQKAVSLTFADDVHFPALQAADMVAFLAKHEALDVFFRQPNMWKRLHDRLVTEPEPGYGVMRWWKIYSDQKQMLKVADSLNNLLKQKEKDAQAQRTQRVPKLRSNNAATDESSTKRDKGRTGRRKGDKSGATKKKRATA